MPTNCPPGLKFRFGEDVKMTEVVSDPAVRNPTGIDVDRAGRIWAVNCHTHFRPDDYAGPEHDEVIVYSDVDGDGKFEASKVFYRRTVATMAAWLHRRRGGARQ